MSACIAKSHSGLTYSKVLRLTVDDICDRLPNSSVSYVNVTSNMAASITTN